MKVANLVLHILSSILLMLWAICPFYAGVMATLLKYAINQEIDVSMTAFCVSGFLSGLIGVGLIWGALAVFFKRKDVSPKKFIAGDMTIWGLTAISCAALIVVLCLMSRGSSLAQNTYETWKGLMIIPVLGIMNTIAGAVLSIISSVKKK